MADEQKITATSYTLRNDNGSWLGQVVLTSDGAFMAITDWGNFNFAWRSNQTLPRFKEFILGLEPCYFANKMVEGIQYIAYGRKIQSAAERFAERVLPKLQEVLKQEIKEEEV